HYVLQEAEVTEMHQTMTGTSQDPDFLARLASLREDADAAVGDEGWTDDPEDFGDRLGLIDPDLHPRHGPPRKKIVRQILQG
ncbi:hypothetical protein LCGC14_1400900, partial [marine sediment metagenome]